VVNRSEEVKDYDDCGMVVHTGDDSGITKTGKVRIVDVWVLGTS
nr:hypothetical protein [Tanacetum cinerariifolium]